MRTELRPPHQENGTIAIRHFSFPHEVIDDPSLNDTQKRSILCEWASDACAIPSFPTLRLLPGTTFPVTYSAVMDALLQLDRRARPKERPRTARHDQGPSIIPLSRREIRGSA